MHLLQHTSIESQTQISSAACGYGFTLLSSKTKDITKVWGMGLNKDSQLGFHRSQKDKTRGYEYVLEPSPVPLPLDRPQETRVLQVSCGRAHSLVLTDGEGVFSMGNNSYGQCGRKVVENEIYSESHTVHRMQDFDGQVVQVACGQDHSLFLTDRGEVYSCGWGADGQTGLGHYNITSTPTRLGGDLAGVNVVQVATYGDCCLAVSADGGLFGWGNSEYLQLASVTDSTQVNVPRCLPFSGVGLVKQAACGGTGCAVLNGEGHVFVWGYGILGKGPNLLETALPEMIPPTLFGLTEFNPGVQVSRIRCGLSHFAALTNRGELFVWGKNIRGCLGIGRLEDQYFPWRLQAAVPPTTAQRREAGDVAPDQHEIRQPSASIICFFFHFNEHFTKYKIYCLFGGNIRYFFSLRHTVHESRGFCVSSRKKESVRALGRAALFSPCPERGTDRSKCHWYCW
nr:RCC1-like G exchanging factor-like protein isoform X4 [Odocoileus virginianus texanus]